MGSWGTGVFDNDDAADVRGAWRQGLRGGHDSGRLTRSIVDAHLSQRRGAHERGLFWVALAAAQSESGRLEPQVRDEALAYLARGGDVTEWADEPIAARRRQRVLDRLAERLRGPQPEPKRLRSPTRPAASAREPQYPFLPRSNAYLRPGQFWAVPLKDGRFAAGRVVHVDRSERYGARTAFVAGLTDWVGHAAPTPQDMQASRVLDMGEANVITIRETGGEILGIADLHIGEDHLHVYSRGPFPVTLLRSGQPDGLATRKQMQQLPVWSGWGSKVIEVLANHIFVDGGRPPSDKASH